IAAASLFCLIFMLSASSLATTLGYEGKERYVQWLSLTIALDTVVAIPFARLRFLNEAKKFALIKLANIGINIIMNLYLLYFVQKSVENVFLANLIASMATLVLLVQSFKNYELIYDNHLVRQLLNYSFPIMLMGLAGMTNEVIDRIMLKYWSPSHLSENERLTQLGIYGACYKLSIFMSIAIQSFRYGAEAFFFAESKEKDAPSTYAMVMHWFVIVCLLIFVGVSLNLDTIKFILRNKEFHKGLAVVPVLLMANLFLGIYYNLSVWFKLSDKTYWGLWLNLFGAVVTIIGNIILMPKYGYIAAAWVTLTCYGSMAALSYGLGQKYFPVPYNVTKICVYITLTFVFTYMVNKFVSGNYFYKFFFKNIFLAAFVYLLYKLELYKLKTIIKFKK
ncbi:MAG TPA: polysaccharide biosynthesis C-terminal domain-containing protein, partial [Cytophagales bacterium]|nr:polysaccharide biosynthesis C-terminal domain-containing protein [Cytophagales bacterium]